ncbi:MAG: phosphatidate cytidylyltransferase [Spirochaetes bacterium]|nr:phosphatidate cytidylyltransferase [Spirochaetota bacterium]
MVNNFKKSTLYRVLTGVIALPVYFFVLWADYFNSFFILIGSLAVSLITLYEYYKLCDKGDDGKPFIIWGLAAGTAANILIYYFAFGSKIGFTYSSMFEARIVLAFIALFLSIILVIQLFGRSIKGGIYSLAVTVFGVIYIAFFFSHIIFMKALQNGFFYILIFNIVIMINDTAAYFGGSLFGRHKLNFAVSPNKSWEGYFSGLVFSVVAMIITNEIYSVFLKKNLFSLIECIIAGAFLSMLGHIGDLVESAIKRDAAKKDSGSFLPGHGGMWDVFDALIFSLPFFYYYLIIKGVS